VYTQAASLAEGQFWFNGLFTNNANADFFMGLPATWDRGPQAYEDRETWHTSMFIQDDWKIRPRVTLNIGLRYGVQEPFLSRSCYNLNTYCNVKEVWRPGQQSTRFPGAPLGIVYAGDAGVPERLYNTRWKNGFEPRIGLAWDVTGDGRTAVRLGYGLLHELVYADIMAQTGGIPVLYNEHFDAPEGGVSDPYFGHNNPWPYVYPVGAPFLKPQAYADIPADFQNPVIHQWTLDVQHQVTSNFMAEIAYIGKKSLHQNQMIQLNAPIYIPGTDEEGNPLSTAANINQRRPYGPDITSIVSVDSNGYGNYHGMQLSSRYRTSRGLSFTGNYTWSKNLDTSSRTGVAGSVQDPFNPYRGEYGRSNNDIRHVVTLSVVYAIPNPLQRASILKHVTGGWEVSAMTWISSGYPFSIRSGIQNSLNGQGADRADVVGDPHISSPSIDKWFNTDAFAFNQIGHVGNSQRNMMNGPSFNNTDFSLMRNFTLGREGLGKLQFRAEFFNVFNKVNLSNPNNNLSSASFGRILGAYPPRIVQFGLKYVR
jgi:hypothetical protein